MSGMCFGAGAYGCASEELEDSPIGSDELEYISHATLMYRAKHASPASNFGILRTARIVVYALASRILTRHGLFLDDENLIQKVTTLFVHNGGRIDSRELVADWGFVLRNEIDDHRRVERLQIPCQLHTSEHCSNSSQVRTTAMTMTASITAPKTILLVPYPEMI